MIYWRKMKRDAEHELDKRLSALQASYRQALVDLTSRERSRLLQYGQQILAPVFSQLSVLHDRYTAHKDALQRQAVAARELRELLDSIEIIAPE